MGAYVGAYVSKHTVGMCCVFILTRHRDATELLIETWIFRKCLVGFFVQWKIRSFIWKCESDMGIPCIASVLWTECSNVLSTAFFYHKSPSSPEQKKFQISLMRFDLIDWLIDFQVVCGLFRGNGIDWKWFFFWSRLISSTTTWRWSCARWCTPSPSSTRTSRRAPSRWAPWRSRAARRSSTSASRMPAWSARRWWAARAPGRAVWRSTTPDERGKPISSFFSGVVCVKLPCCCILGGGVSYYHVLLSLALLSRKRKHCKMWNCPMRNFDFYFLERANWHGFLIWVSCGVFFSTLVALVFSMTCASACILLAFLRLICRGTIFFSRNFSTGNNQASFCSLISMNAFIFSVVRGSLWNYWHPPSWKKRRKIYLRCSLWGLSPSFDHLNQDWKKGKKLHVVLTPSSTSLLVKTAIPCVLPLQFWEQGRIAGG